VKTPPTLPELPDWPAPDQRAEVWPRPMTRAQREAARYRASKIKDRPIPKGWRHPDNATDVTLTNGRTITVNLLPMRWGMLEQRPRTWAEHDQHHAELYRQNPSLHAYYHAHSRYVLGGISAWPDVAVCNTCGRAGHDANPYVVGTRPEGYRSLFDDLDDERAAALRRGEGVVTLMFPDRADRS
jgi:hypothetical protein